MGEQRKHAFHQALIAQFPEESLLLTRQRPRLFVLRRRFVPVDEFSPGACHSVYLAAWLGPCWITACPEEPGPYLFLKLCERIGAMHSAAERCHSTLVFLSIRD